MVVQDGLLYKCVGPLTDGNCVHSSKFEERGDPPVSGHQDGRTLLLLEDSEEGQEVFQLGRIEYRRPSILPGLSSMCHLKDDQTKAQGRDEEE